MIGLVKADSKQLASSDSEKLGINCHELKLHELKCSTTWNCYKGIPVYKKFIDDCRFSSHKSIIEFHTKTK